MPHTSKAIAYEEDLFREESYDDVDETSQEHFSDRQDLIRRTPWWLISIVFHSAFLVMAAMWTISQGMAQEEFSIFEMNLKKFKRPEYDPTIKRDIKRTHKQVKDEVHVENPIVTKEDLQIDELETPDDMEREHKAKGRQEAISTIELEGEGWVGVFGVGGGGSGAYGWRNGGGKRRAIGQFGGGAATESAVLAALRWFKRHQAPDGSWSYAKYHQQCKLNPPCEHKNIRSIHKRENSATGLGLLCFLGAGHTHKAGKFRQQVADGLAFLKGAQDNDGSFSSCNYVHGITTMALAEAYGMTKSSELKELAQKAVDIILSRQNEYLGWDYRKPTPRNDLSITGWQIMALKSAKSSGLDIGNAFEGGKKFVDKVTPELIGDDYEPQLAGKVAYTYNSDTGALGHRGMRGLTNLPAIGLLCRIFIGEDTNSRMLRAHGNRLLEHLPTTYKNGNMYFWYYATLGMFQMKGKFWDQWNKALKKVLCENQRVGGCADGSWDPTTNSIDFGSTVAGRVFSTAVGCLSLEVYYRYLPVAMLK